MQFACTPSKWLVTLRDSREVIEVWADGFSKQEDCYEFSILVDATVDEQALLDVTGRTPTNPARVIVTVARFPADSIEDPRSA